MDMQQQITEKVKTNLTPSYIEVINESHNHSGDATESHFKLIVVADKFNDLSLIKRHKYINQLLKAEIANIHALALHTYTKPEWQQKNQVPESPQCQGGSK